MQTQCPQASLFHAKISVHVPWYFCSVFLFSGPIAVPPLQLQLPVDVPVEQIKGQYLAGQLPIHWCQKWLLENYQNGLHKQRLGWNEKCVNIWQFEWSLILNADWLVICLMPTTPCATASQYLYLGRQTDTSHFQFDDRSIPGGKKKRKSRGSWVTSHKLLSHSCFSCVGSTRLEWAHIHWHLPLGTQRTWCSLRSFISQTRGKDVLFQHGCEPVGFHTELQYKNGKQKKCIKTCIWLPFQVKMRSLSLCFPEHIATRYAIADTQITAKRRWKEVFSSNERPH